MTGGAPAQPEVLCPAQPEALLLSEAVVKSHTVGSVYIFMNCCLLVMCGYLQEQSGRPSLCCTHQMARNLIMKHGDGLLLKFTFFWFIRIFFCIFALIVIL